MATWSNNDLERYTEFKLKSPYFEKENIVQKPTNPLD